MKKIEDYTLEELKALAYDLISQKEQTEARLRSVNQLIGNFKPKVEGVEEPAKGAKVNKTP